jgi:hypothetical protein
MYSFDARHGEYDGWEIWNMRARFLFRGSHWVDGFTNLLDYSHPDYPLLLPASIARSWLYSGIETQITPIMIALAFTFGTVALLTFSLWQLRSKSQGLLAGLALVGTPFFIIHGASQYADVPIGFYFLATLVLLNLHGRLEADRRPLVLAGMTAGLAAWTKNEGLLFVGAIVLALAVVSAISIKGWKHCLDRVWPVCLGLVPILAVIVYFKIAVAPPNDMVAGQGLAVTLGRLLTLSRYLETGKAFVEQLFSFGVWHPYTNIPILLAFYLLLLGVDLSGWPIGVGVCVATLLLVICAYFITYIVTPRPLQWHLMTSLNRLCLQLWPCFLFTYFLIVRTPETAMSGSKKIKPQRFRRVQQRSVEELAAADQARL